MDFQKSAGFSMVVFFMVGFLCKSSYLLTRLQYRAILHDNVSLQPLLHHSLDTQSSLTCR